MANELTPVAARATLSALADFEDDYYEEFVYKSDGDEVWVHIWSVEPGEKGHVEMNILVPDREQLISQSDPPNILPADGILGEVQDLLRDAFSETFPNAKPTPDGWYLVDVVDASVQEPHAEYSSHSFDVSEHID